MEQRIDYTKQGNGVSAALFGMTKTLSRSSIEMKLQHLVELRVSQINHCAFCIDMHSKDLRHEGETEQRLYMLNAWRESDLYTSRERAAFAWAEAVTCLSDGWVSDDVYDEVKKEFSDDELVDLTFVVTAINTWNRFNVAFRMPSGTYQPGQYASFNA